jgi:dTDP-4-amino-4,6-dideoxygalactose transaminase
VRHPQAARLAEALAARGIGARQYYARPIHRQPPMAAWAPPAGALPGTEVAARTHLAIPMSAALAPAQVDEVAAAIADAGLGRLHQ